MGAREAVGNPLRERFKREILKHGKANLASRDAGYTDPRAGDKLLQIPDVVDDIRKLHRSQMKRLQMSADEVVIGLSRIARFDTGAIFDSNGCILPLNQWPEEARLCVNSVEMGKPVKVRGPDGEERWVQTIHKVKFNDRLQALTTLGRVHNLYAQEAQEIGRGIAQEADIIRRMEQGRARAAASALPVPDNKVVLTVPTPALAAPERK